MLIPKPIYKIARLPPSEEHEGDDAEEEEMKLMDGNNQDEKLLGDYDEIADGGEEM